MSNAPVVFQRDGSILISGGAGWDQAVAAVRRIGQLRAIVAGNHVYDLSTIALWGSAARGVTAEQVFADLEQWSAMPVPTDLAARIVSAMGRYGEVEIVDRGDSAAVVARSQATLDALGLDIPADGSLTAALSPSDVVAVKLAAVRAGWPVIDRRVVSGSHQPIVATDTLHLRPYQQDGLRPFLRGRDGVVLLPCGAGKTVVGVAAAANVGGPVLVLVPSRTVGEQWQATFLQLTDCTPQQIAWVQQASPETLVVTATYQAATSGNAVGQVLGRPWRLVIYDEVQSLPARMFRQAAQIEADRRLGLSATLVREDGREAEVFALIGPPLFEASWLELERDGWIAPARCYEVRVPEAPTDAERLRYKMAAVSRLLDAHIGEPTLVVGTDVASLRATGRRLGFPVLTGESSAERRADAFARFRDGEITTLGLSRIGSVGVDLPGASVLIQLSGTFGSRQEEAQRLGRILRPANGKTARFYTVVAAGTREPHFASRRQRFLVNQGYVYEIMNAADLPRPSVDLAGQ